MTDTTGPTASAVRGGDRRALAQAITMVESTRPTDRQEAEALIDEVLPATGNSVRLGVTGTPGVGKSTFIDAVGQRLVDDGHRLAVLAVDPTSSRNGGSILGDKTRMAGLSARAETFIRPSPSGGLTGGVARRTRDALLLCEAAGYDVVIVETMGVGQAEIAVSQICDLFLLLVAPGGGDELQGIKRGVMELADVVAVNKADGELAAAARHTAADYRHALHMVRPKWPGLPTPVVTCSALRAEGLDELWSTVMEIHGRLSDGGELCQLRSAQAAHHFAREFEQLLTDRVRALPSFDIMRDEIESAVRAGSRAPGGAAAELARRAWAELA